MKQAQERYRGSTVVATVAVLILAMLAIPACAGGDGEDSASDGDGRTVLEVGYLPILPVAQLFVIEGAGWAEDAGLDLRLTRFSDGPAMVQAVASGELDVMYFGIGPAMVARSRGQDIEVLASAIIEQIAFIADEPLARLFGGSRSPEAARDAFEAFYETEGRPVSIATFPAGSVPNTVLRYWLEEQLGIPDDLVEIVSMGSDQVQQALLTGRVDAASILEPTLTIVEERAPNMTVVARASEMFPGQPGAVLAVRRDTREEHREAIDRLVELHIRATEHLQNEVTASAEYMSEFVGGGAVDLSTLERALESPSTNFTSDPAVIRESTARMQDFQLRIGALSEAVDLDELFHTDVYDRVE
ncbi:MAG: ABC transporter substrate-binding protein [Spirochaetaceae bacterium]